MPSTSVLLNLKGKTRAELLEQKLQLELEISKIRTQLDRARDEARHTGKYADGRWWLKTHQALRIKGKQCQQIQAVLHALRQDSLRNLESRFVTLAKQELPEEVFRKLLEKAQT